LKTVTQKLRSNTACSLIYHPEKRQSREKNKFE